MTVVMASSCRILDFEAVRAIFRAAADRRRAHLVPFGELGASSANA